MADTALCWKCINDNTSACKMSNPKWPVAYNCNQYTKKPDKEDIKGAQVEVKIYSKEVPNKVTKYAYLP